MPEGGIIALNGEAGFQAEVLRGGMHFGLWRWQYRIHKVPLVTVPQGKIGYVYARDGEPLAPSQTLGCVVPCNNFQDARGFLVGEQLGPRPGDGHRPARPAAGDPPRRRLRHQPRALLRAHRGHRSTALDTGGAEGIQDAGQLADRAGRARTASTRWSSAARSRPPTRSIPSKKILVDSMGIVTVHDGPSLPPGEIIAPAVGTDRNDKFFHNNYQDPEAFLLGGGRRGLQYVPLTDGTYFINRWFATIESIPKTIVPIGYVGVIVSYYGRIGHDLSGQSVPPRRARRPRASAASRRSRWARASMRSTPTPAASSWCRRPTSCSTG